MLISTGLPLPMCSSIRESEFSVPVTSPTCRLTICFWESPCRLSAPAISQFCPADWPEKAGSVTERLSLESR